MSSRHHIDDFMRGRIIGKIEEGENNRCCQEFRHRSQRCSRLWKSFKTNEMRSGRHGEVVLEEKQISRKTVARRLRGGGLYARRPVVCVPLTRQHRTARLQWCREHHNWTEQDWACVLFSDESRFSLSSDCRRQLDLAREWYCLIVQKISRKRPISDMQYHGVGRHHDQWPHEPTCGCKWDYDGPTIH
ncbi:hypothetical protein TNCV_1846121 [Trichonephila clavipes]|nr:hypothetical protein TNCV_1846121 [Trichonephila clavipes]